MKISTLKFGDLPDVDLSKVLCTDTHVHNSTSEHPIRPPPRSA